MHELNLWREIIGYVPSPDLKMNMQQKSAS